MPKYHIFHGSTGNRVAVTDDKTGAKLPKRDYGAWIFKETKDFIPNSSGTILSHDAVIAAVTERGYYVWPEPKEGA